MSDDKRHVFTVEIAATPEQIWEAMTNSEHSTGYFYGTAFGAPDLRPGTAYSYKNEAGDVTVTGRIIEVDPPRRLVTTWAAQWDDNIRKEPPSRVTWEIESRGELCTVTVLHDQLEQSPIAFSQVTGGWPEFLAGLKRVVETGERPVSVG